MYSTGGFTAFMIDYKPFVKDTVPYFNIKLKVVSKTPFQTLMNSLDQLPNSTSRYSRYFDGDVLWDAIEFKDMNLDTEVTVEGNDTFDGQVRSVKCVKKVKDSGEEYTYTINVVKEVTSDNLDKILLSSYLNVTEPDEDGKERKKELLFQFAYID